jgi:hypothetical protein
MNCPNCVLGDLQLRFRGELRFDTDEQGRPMGEAEIRKTDGEFLMTCDTCEAAYLLDGWSDDGKGPAMLREASAALGVEPDSGTQFD